MSLRSSPAVTPHDDGDGDEPDHGDPGVYRLTETTLDIESLEERTNVRKDDYPADGDAEEAGCDLPDEPRSDRCG
jgi:hypothetical protein